MRKKRAGEIKNVSEAIIEALLANGVEYIFANLGTDHTPIIEALAKYRFLGKKVPEVIICPHEIVAMSAAHGYAHAKKSPQVVLVHVDAGTANLGGSVHNAFRSRIPALIMAGRSPLTLEGELKGGRDDYIKFPRNHPLHLGFNVNDYLGKADLIFVIDCDVPWIPSRIKPKDQTKIIYLDIDR